MPRTKKSPQEQFEAFDAKHPDVYQMFKKLAYQVRAKRTHYSARHILSAISFHSAVDGRDVEKWKLNNNYSPYFARKLMREDALNFGSFFETRKLKAA